MKEGIETGKPAGKHSDSQETEVESPSFWAFLPFWARRFVNSFSRLTRKTRLVAIGLGHRIITACRRSIWPTSPTSRTSRTKLAAIMLVVIVLGTGVGLGASSIAFAGSGGGAHHGAHHGKHGKKGKKGHHKLSGVSSVIAASAVSGTATYQLTLSGTVSPKATLTIAATNSGTVTAVDVSTGQTVQAGQAVATVTSPTLAGQLAVAQTILQNAQTNNSANQQGAIIAAQAGVSKAQAGLDQAQFSLDNAERAEQTAQTDASETSSDSDSTSSDQTALGTAQQNVILAQANLNAAQDAMTEAQNQLSQAQNPTPATALIQAQAQVQLLQSEIAQETVRAPFAGVVVSVPAVTGQQVGAGTALATLDTATLIINTPLSQQDLALVHTGEEATASVAGASGTLPLTVQAVAPSGNPGSLTFGVTFAVTAPTQPAWLLPGESAVVNVTTKKYSPAVLIPAEAIVSINGTPQVFEIHSNHTVSLSNVTPGVSDGTTTMVSGLTAGTLVVAVGQTYLANGGRVKISSSIPVASTVVGTAVAGLANITTTLPSPTSTAKKGGKGGGGAGAGGGGGGGLGGLGGGKKG